MVVSDPVLALRNGRHNGPPQDLLRGLGNAYTNQKPDRPAFDDGIEMQSVNLQACNLEALIQEIEYATPHSHGKRGTNK